MKISHLTFKHFTSVLSEKGLLVLNVILGISVTYLTFVYFLKVPSQVVYAEKNFSVREISDKAQEVLQDCPEQNKQACLKNEMMAMTTKFGLLNGEKILNKIQKSSDDAKNCHVISHFMSRSAYKKDPQNLDKLLDTLNVNACGSGYLHGVLEAYVSDHPEIKIDGNFAELICGRGNDTYRQHMCAHFMGHIFLLETEGNLDPALLKCDTIRQDWKFDCYDGLFMEDHQKLALVEHEIVTMPELNPTYLKQLETVCKKYDGQKSVACWTEMAEMYAHFTWYDSDKIYSGCMQAQTVQEKQSCYNKGIVVTAVYNGFDTKEKLLGICKYFIGQEAEYQNCNNQIISAFMYYSPKYTSRGITLCSNLQGQNKDWCFNELGKQLKKIVPSSTERETLCQSVEEKYKTKCVQE